jgi:hypothetical protein
MKPDLQACLMLAANVGGIVVREQRGNNPVIEVKFFPGDFERLIHAAYELGRKDAAMECAEIGTLALKYFDVDTSEKWMLAYQRYRDDIRARFNLTETNWSKM